jgi:tRNA A-37 threonylcarbamoyl transferase component Bud32
VTFQYIIKKIIKEKFIIIKKFKTNNNKFIIIKKNNKTKIVKIFLNKRKTYYKNELLGYNSFYKYKYKNLNLPKLSNISLSKKTKHIVVDYINGKKPGIYDLKKILESNMPNIINKMNVTKYIKEIEKHYHKNITKKKISLITSKIKHSNILTTNSHGDYAFYNMIKRKNKIFLIDFEKFRNRIIFFDQINLIAHTSLFNISKYLVVFKKFYIYNKLSTLISNNLYYLIYFLLKKKLNFYNIYIKDFKLYYILYLIEKKIIFNIDIKDLNRIDEIKYIKKIINIINLNISYLIKKL